MDTHHQLLLNTLPKFLNKELKRERYLLKKHIWRENNREKTNESAKIYYMNNKAKCKESHKKWCENNPEKLKEGKRQWVINNYERVNEIRKKWESNNLEKSYKSHKIASWKYNGLIGNYEEIFDRFINTNNCDLCDVVLTTDRFNTKTTKSMEHSHITGELRNIVCHSCNIKLPKLT